jgi:hypothetical protein
MSERLDEIYPNDSSNRNNVFDAANNDKIKLKTTRKLVSEGIIDLLLLLFTTVGQQWLFPRKIILYCNTLLFIY